MNTGQVIIVGGMYNKNNKIGICEYVTTSM